MEWGFVIAIIGVVVILLSTVWYFASYLRQLSNILSNTGTIQSNNSDLSQATPCVPPTTVPTTAANITLSKAWSILVFPTGAAVGWAAGALMVVIGGIWGTYSTVQKNREKPDSRLNAILAALSTSPKSGTPAPAPATTSTPTNLTEAELSALRKLLASSS